jgi:phosphatidate cytidylyltransferase
VQDRPPPDEDLDPPTFRFGEAKQREVESEEELEIPRFDPPEEEGDEAGTQEAPALADEAKPPLWRRLPFARGETGARVVVAIPWVIAAIVLVAVGGELFAAGMIGLGILGLREYFRMTEATQPLAIPAYLTVSAMVIAALYGGSFQILLVFAAGFLVIFAFAAARNMPENLTISIAITVLGIAWLGLGLSHAMLLRDLPDHGGALLIDVLVATFVGDTAAYGAGRLFGSRKITPRISPNKTLEGLIGGFIGGTMGFWFAGLYQDWLPGMDALLMGMAVAAIAPIGDLFASMIKRDLEIKDTGTLFGPHGGLIDRLDAVLFTVVAGYYLSVAFVY